VDGTVRGGGFGGRLPARRLRRIEPPADLDHNGGRGGVDLNRGTGSGDHHRHIGRPGGHHVGRLERLVGGGGTRSHIQVRPDRHGGLSVLADFNGIQLDASEKAGTPDYVQVKLTNLGPGSIQTSDDDPSIELEGVDDTGNLQDDVTFFGDFPRCPQNTAPSPWPAGKSFSTCLTFLVPGGINKVGYVGTNNYLTSPVIWSAG
jgi:hypothetical protein